MERHDPIRPDAGHDADPVRIDVVIAIVTRGGKVLICQRPEGKSFGGFWEFPGGKREPCETIEQCLRRELKEELAIEVTPLRPLTTVDHDYPRGPIRLHPFVCAHAGGEVRPLACLRAEWIDPAQLNRYQFPPANDRLIAEAMEALSAPVDFPAGSP